MNQHLDQVRQFLEAMEMPYAKRPAILSHKLCIDRHHLMLEELQEYLQATTSDSLYETLDALVDLQYLLLGTVLTHGLQDVFEEAFNRVHDANMQKEPGQNSRRRLMNTDAVKPIGWKPANLGDLV